MADNVNLVLDDEVLEELAQLVPAGERNLFVNEALRARLNLLKRQRAVDSGELLARLRTRERVELTESVAAAVAAEREGRLS